MSRMCAGLIWILASICGAVKWLKRIGRYVCVCVCVCVCEGASMRGTCE